MTTGTPDGAREQDRRMEAKLDVVDPRHSLHDLLRRFRGPDPAKEAQATFRTDTAVMLSPL